ncbi:MAG: MerR family transcriptional regulator [Acidimicrobiales bacterium]
MGVGRRRGLLGPRGDGAAGRDRPHGRCLRTVSPQGERLSISEVACRSGVRATALRYYETIGLLPAPPRVSGRRQYDASVLDRLVVISTARHAGFTLAEVRELLDGMTAGAGTRKSWRAMAGRKLPEVDCLIERFEAMRRLLEAVAGCECRDVAQCAALLRGCDETANGARGPT